MVKAKESLKFRPKWTIVKFRSKYQEKMDELHHLLHVKGMSVEAVKDFGYKPYETLSFEGNVALDEGVNALWTLVCGGSETAYNNANARIGVGDSSTAESQSQTGLQGSNKFWKGMDTGYPTFGTARKATWRATFGSTEANFAWNEITVVNAADDSGKNLNRKVQSMGTKASGSVWIATLEISA
jgi:hypothetical protein